MAKYTYRGIVRDKLNILKERKTRHYPALYRAYEAGERLCEKHMGERGRVSVAVFADGVFLVEY